MHHVHKMLSLSFQNYLSKSIPQIHYLFRIFIYIFDLIYTFILIGISS